MPLLEQTDIDKIKQSTDLLALVQSRGVQLKQQGKNYIGYCPFHDDKKTPNLIVTPSKGLFRCMASNCGKTGNAIQFIQHFDGISFRHACEVLSKGTGIEYKPPTTTNKSQPLKKSTVPKLPCTLDQAAHDYELLEQVISYYHERLTNTPSGQVALDYLHKRGLTNQAMIAKFKLGYADRSLGLTMPQKNRVAGAELRTKLQTLGIYRDNGREHLRGCLTVPIYNAQSQPVQLYGRRIQRAEKHNRHLYLAKPLNGIFNHEALTALNSDELIITESIIDALSFYQAGLINVTCTYGTANFTEELYEAIKQSKVRTIKLAFDNDPAGETATSKVSERLQSIGLEVYQIKFPRRAESPDAKAIIDYSDANGFMVKHGEEALKQAHRNAIYLNHESNVTPAPIINNKNLAAKAESFLATQSPEKGEASNPSVSSVPSVVQLQKQGEHHLFLVAKRTYKITGLDKNHTLDTLRITLRITDEQGNLHIDNLDLYRDNERKRFIDRASEELACEKLLIKRDLGKLLLALETHQEQSINASNDPSLATNGDKVLSEAETTQALELLKSPNLLAKIAQAYNQAGIIGEDSNKLAAYLACTSRKLQKPLAIIIQSTSAAGKSTLMEAVLSFFPSEHQIKYSAMTGQSLYYLGETNLQHKILAIVEEEGAEKASYALKLLQSEGELNIASTGKDAQSGRMQTQTYHVQGPVALVFTTTSIDIDEELMNRCLVLTVDESAKQTQRIHELQRQARTVEGIMQSENKKDIITLMQNAQRLIKPYKIANPYAKQLTFTSGRTRTRRDHEKYLTLIDSIALLHQHQRERKVLKGGVEYIEVTLQDIEHANKLAPELLGRSLDELPPQTSRLLESIKSLVRTKLESDSSLEQEIALFSRRELREYMGWSEFQIRMHLERLEQMEYIRRKAGRQGAVFSYELLVESTAKEEVYHIGLIDINKLKSKSS